ncbi:hypothetical protein GCM10025734_72610 [Kitasatospora paranensis]|uniref:hypothetical protein n=1 Tax=Kitasatospora paranensis TaxID=258053 RepID=UPI0031F1AF49
MPRQPAGPRPGRPDPAVLHRAVRVTAAACIGFYTFRYGLGQPVTATYALFGAIAIGVLARIGGSAQARVRTLGLTLPAAWALICLGTVLAVHAWTAALGMVGVGFAVAYGSVGGPRMVGLANGLQLLYILPCFPPYAPDALPQRLGGVSAGILLLAAAELLLWPERPPPAYRDRLAAAVAAVADLADRAADHAGAAGIRAVDGSPGRPGRPSSRRTRPGRGPSRSWTSCGSPAAPRWSGPPPPAPSTAPSRTARPPCATPARSS